MAAPSRRSTRAHRAWNVPIATSRPASSPIRPVMRARSSAAALLVNVTARICHGLTPLTPTRYATRWARTRVLPLPAPARMRTGPSVVRTARCCSGFSRARIRAARASVAACRSARATGSGSNGDGSGGSMRGPSKASGGASFGGGGSSTPGGGTMSPAGDPAPDPSVGALHQSPVGSGAASSRAWPIRA